MLKLRTIGGLTVLKIVGILLSVVYYMLQVDYFGLSREIEHYFVAYSLLVIAFSLTIAGFIAEMVLPLIHKQQKQFDKVVVEKTVSVVLNWLFLFTGLLCVFLCLIAGNLTELIAPGFSISDQETTSMLFRWIIFSLILQVVNVIFNSFFHAKEIYGRTEWVIIIRVIVSIFVLIYFFQSLGIWTLVLNVWAQQVISFIITFIILYRIKYKHYFLLSIKEFNHRLFFKKASSAYFYSFSNQLFQFVLTALVSYLPIGVYAVYKYIDNIMVRIISVVLSPTTTIFFTDFSNAFNQKSKQLYLLLRKAHNFNFLVAALATVLFISFGDNVLQFLWGANYNTSNKGIAYTFLILNVLALFFLNMQHLFNAVVLVHQQSKQLYLIQGLACLINTLFAIIAIKNFESWGLASVILLSAFTSALFLAFILYQINKKIFRYFDTGFILRAVLMTGILLMVGYFLNQYLNIEINSFGNRANNLINLSIKSLLLSLLFVMTYFILGLQKRTYDV